MNASSRAPSSPLVRLLLVDAHGDDHRLLSDLLDSIPAARFLVDAAKTLAEGLDQAKRAAYDLCLLGLPLPDGDGLDLIASIEGLGIPLPVVVLADRPTIDQDRRAMTLGAAALLDKRLLDPATLERTLRYAIHQRKIVTGLSRQAFLDEATSLISRALYRDRLNRALAFARRRERQVAVMMIDLAFDLDQGGDGRLTDAVLAEAGRRLIEGLRETDSVARLSERWLGLLIEGMHSLDHAATVARRALGTLRTPLAVGETTVAVTPSLGIAVYPHEGGDGDLLMRRAEGAVRRALDEGGGCCRFASERIDHEAREMMVLEKAFVTAFEHRDLCLRFHPEMHVTNRRSGLAAEIFWRHPEQGWMPFDAAGSDSEDETLIKGFVDWSLAAAAAQLLTWRREGLKGPPLSIAIPFKHPSTLALLKDAVVKAIEPGEIRAEQIELDLRESLIFGDARQGFANLVSLKATGVRLALDKFGEGRTAIQDLRHDLLDGLKLTPELYRRLPGDDRRETLLGALIDLGHKLDLTVTAKGTADERQFGLLKRLGCDIVQLAALPAMSVTAAASWLRSLAMNETGKALERGALRPEILVPDSRPVDQTKTTPTPPLSPD